MNEKRKGIKRHESLYPLSHHHHHALFMALNLKQAGTDKSKQTLEELKMELAKFWKQGGQEHFREEEEILLPVYAQFTDIEKQPEVVKMLVEHVQIRARILQITSTESPEAELFRDLGQLLDTHIRTEERVIFPMIEKAVPEEKLMDLSAYLHVNHHAD